MATPECACESTMSRGLDEGFDISASLDHGGAYENPPVRFRTLRWRGQAVDCDDAS
jgi:hypothetical protein